VFNSELWLNGAYQAPFSHNSRTNVANQPPTNQRRHDTVLSHNAPLTAWVMRINVKLRPGCISTVIVKRVTGWNA